MTQPPTLCLSGSATEGVPTPKLDGHHLIIKCTIEDPPRRLDTHALVDCGATGYAFIDKDYASQHNLPLYTLKDPRQLEVIDGRPIDSGDITHITKIGLDINGHREQVSAFVPNLATTLWFLEYHGFDTTTHQLTGQRTPLTLSPNTAPQPVPRGQLKP